MAEDYYVSYQEGYRKFKEGDLSAAKSKFAYIYKNSIDPIANNCLRWCGIISMGLEEYGNAEKCFTDLIKRLKANEKFDLAIEKVIDPNLKESQETLEALVNHDLGYIYINLKDYLKAEEQLKKSIENSGINSGTKAWFLNDLGLCYFEWGKFDKAIEQYDEVLKLDLDPSYLKGYPYLYRGLALFEKNDLVRAKESLLKAKANFESTDKRPPIELVKASIFINIGRIEIINKDLDEADFTLKNAGKIYADESNKKHIESLTLKEKKKEERNIITLKILEGIIQYEERKYEEAEKNLKDLDSALALNTLGCIYIKMNDSEKGKDIAKKTNDDKEKSEDYIEKAKNSFEKARKKAEDNQNESLRVIINKNLKLLGQEKKKEEPLDWWDWWNSSDWKKKMGGSLAALLIFSLVMGTIIIPFGLFGFNTGYSNETTIVTIEKTNSSLIKNSSVITNTTEIPSKTDMKVESPESTEKRP